MDGQEHGQREVMKYEAVCPPDVSSYRPGLWPHTPPHVPPEFPKSHAAATQNYTADTRPCLYDLWKNRILKISRHRSKKNSLSYSKKFWSSSLIYEQSNKCRPYSVKVNFQLWTCIVVVNLNFLWRFDSRAMSTQVVKLRMSFLPLILWMLLILLSHVLFTVCVVLIYVNLWGRRLHGGDLEGWGTVPSKIWGGGRPMHPSPNILRSSVCRMRAKARRTEF